MERKLISEHLQEHYSISLTLSPSFGTSSARAAVGELGRQAVQTSEMVWLLDFRGVHSKQSCQVSRLFRSLAISEEFVWWFLLFPLLSLFPARLSGTAAVLAGFPQKSHLIAGLRCGVRELSCSYSDLRPHSLVLPCLALAYKTGLEPVSVAEAGTMLSSSPQTFLCDAPNFEALGPQR